MRIKELRQAKDLSQRELAELAGVPKSTLGEIELYLRLPRPEYLKRIARVLGVSINDLWK